MILDIHQIGDPILTKKALPIVNIEDYWSLIADMIETLEYSWVGLAAPQVGQSVQLFIIRQKPTSNYPHLEDTGPQVIINPIIHSHSNEQEEDREWCLSIPDLRGKVPRRKRVEATYQNESWQRIEKRFNEFESRIFQHEYDHLQGIFFLEQMNWFSSLCTTDRYKKNK